jgi:tripartite-type tricarboxylate transporter receptor subunit TctC
MAENDHLCSDSASTMAALDLAGRGEGEMYFQHVARRFHRAGVLDFLAGKFEASRVKTVGEGLRTSGFSTNNRRRSIRESLIGGTSMNFGRRKFIQVSLGAAVLPAMAGKAWSQSYPSRPITLVVFLPAGAIPDLIGRLIGDALSQRLGQPIIIENRPGAGGNIALQAVARAAADGHTLLLLASPHAINVTLYPNNPFGLAKDIVPVASLNHDTFALLVNPSVPAKTVSEFIAYAKANPGKINLSSNGTGNLTHLAGELFKTATGIDALHVPYRGSPAALAALTAGDVQALFDTVGTSFPLIQAGNIRALGVSSMRRVRMLPDVQTIAETVPGYTVTGWLGIGAPKDTSAEIVQRLNREIAAVLNEPGVMAKMAELNSDPFVSTPEEFAKFTSEDAEKWGKVVKAAGIKVE